jgi:hypothetical protein
LTNLVGQVQKETESELLAVKGQIQVISTDLADQIEEHRTEVNSNINKLGQDLDNRLTQQKECLDQATTQEKSVFESKIEHVNAKIVALENKILGLPRSAVVAQPQAVDFNSVCPSIANMSDQNRGIVIGNSVLADGNHPRSCQANSCDVCVQSNVNASRMIGSREYSQVSSFLSTLELPLLLFDDCSDTNPVFHLCRLDEFMRFKGIPKALQLAVAYWSIVGQMSKQWVETITVNLKDYDEFKKEF